MIERISHLNQRKMRKITVARKTATLPTAVAISTDDEDEDEDLAGKY